MATFGEKIEKYRSRILEAQALGIEPRDRDVDKLMYYVSRAKKHGTEHETRTSDKVHHAKIKLKTAVKWTSGEALAEAAKVLAAPVAALAAPQDD